MNRKALYATLIAAVTALMFATVNAVYSKVVGDGLVEYFGSLTMKTFPWSLSITWLLIIAVFATLRLSAPATRFEVLDRDAADKRYGSLKKRIEAARSAVWISGIDCAQLLQAHTSVLRRALDKKIEVRVMLVDPDSAAGTLVHLTDARFDNAQAFQDAARRAISDLEALRLAFPTLEYRLLPVVPATTMVIIDRGHGDSLVKIEVQVPREYKTQQSRPNLVFSSGDLSWRNATLDQWRQYWLLAATSYNRGARAGRQ